MRRRYEMVTANYYDKEKIIKLCNGQVYMDIDLEDAEDLIDRLRQILDEHPEEPD
jgi:hypothetical protein